MDKIIVAREKRRLRNFKEKNKELSTILDIKEKHFISYRPKASPYQIQKVLEEEARRWNELFDRCTKT
jgi:hypothetical protein